MKHGILVAILFAYIGTCTGAATAQPTAAKLKVFLQGASSDELRKLVEAQGGRVTHDLHIIDAVGAELTRKQLEVVLDSPLVNRHFDDLSMSAPPEDNPGEASKNCDIGGSLELDIDSKSISWRIYNKNSATVHLEQLEISWPDKLGAIDEISLGGKRLALPPSDSADLGSVILNFGDTAGREAPPLSGVEDLQVRFQSSTSLPPQQRDFDLKARFSGDCSIELIPGYNDNHENFHYNNAAGVDALHLNGITGKGITVAVIDSGLWEDPSLALDTHGNRRILARYDAIADAAGEAVFDASGHGTHMTSIIAHNGAASHSGIPTGTFKGVAPDANLVIVKAFDVAGKGDFLDIVRAVQWIVDNRKRYNIRVLNLSFAARPRWPYWLDPIGQAVMRAWATGITVVAAAGNEGPDPMTIGSPGNLPFIITVGAVTDSWTPGDRDDDYIPDFSSRGPTPSAHIKPDVVAPGGHITGITRPGSTLTLEHPEYLLRTGEFVMTGSSQASALVAGIAALLLQLEPDLTPDDIKCKLMSSAEPAINRDGLLAYSPFQQGYGYVNASRAVTLGQRGCGNDDLDIRSATDGKEPPQGPAIVEEGGRLSLPGLDKMVSMEPSEKGASKSRRWGVKAHIERLDSPTPDTRSPDAEIEQPIDWMGLYLQEKARIEDLARPPPTNP